MDAFLQVKKALLVLIRENPGIGINLHFKHKMKSHQFTEFTLLSSAYSLQAPKF